MKTMLETLNETTSFYTSKNRGVDESGFCRFVTDDGKMCAVGRCMKIPECAHLSMIEDQLKPEYRGYPLKFWTALRVLHDCPRFWDDGGLSDEGVNHIAIHPVLGVVASGEELPS